jgi:hypothetical protein
MLPSSATSRTLIEWESGSTRAHARDRSYQCIARSFLQVWLNVESGIYPRGFCVELLNVVPQLRTNIFLEHRNE